MQFTKVHGLGNDFVLVYAPEQTDLPADLPALARKVCHRNFGIGADGLVILWPSDAADLRMQILNSDGSEAEMCGNAIRCVAIWAYRRSLVTGETLRVATPAGVMVPVVQVDEGQVNRVRVDMGEPVLERSNIPMTGPAGRVVDEPFTVNGLDFRITTVSMGNPHCIIFVPSVGDIPLADWGPLIETHPDFPRKTNVEFVQVLGPDLLRMRVWERGAGPTMACGTGACATAVAAHLNGLTGRRVQVQLEAGALEIEWSENNHVYMTGPAEEVFSGTYPI